MKRLLAIIAAFVTGIFSLTFIGCSSNPGNTVVYPNSMTATLGGVFAFSASGPSVIAGITNGTLNISATAATKAKITMTVPAYSHTLGAISINNIGLPAGATYDSLGNGIVLLASRGTITLTSVAPYLEGTFSFVCSDSTTVNTGAFKILAP